MTMYQSSKFAVVGLAETLRVELASENIGVSVLFPSRMLSRHLETSEAAQPAGVRRPVAGEGDLEAVTESNPKMSQFLAMPEDAAAGVVEQVLAGELYVITHGDFIEAIDARAERIRDAAQRAVRS